VALCVLIFVENIQYIDQLDKGEGTNLVQQILPCSKGKRNILEEVIHEIFSLPIIYEEVTIDFSVVKSLDFTPIPCVILDCSSPKNYIDLEVGKEESLNNMIIRNCTNIRESFHFLIYNSFYFLYPDLFVDLDLHKIYFDLFATMSSRLDFYEM